VAYYDANKTGQLVSRIMTDVEGNPQPRRHRPVEFIGGLLTAVMALVLLLRISATRPSFAGHRAGFGAALQRAFKTVRPIFRERGRINAEVTGRLTESLGGVRVIKGYHAEDARPRSLWRARSAARQRDEELTVMSMMALSATVLMGVVGPLIMYLGARNIMAGTMTLGEFVTFTAFLDS